MSVPKQLTAKYDLTPSNSHKVPHKVIIPKRDMKFLKEVCCHLLVNTFRYIKHLACLFIVSPFKWKVPSVLQTIS